MASGSGQPQPRNNLAPLRSSRHSLLLTAPTETGLQVQGCRRGGPRPGRGCALHAGPWGLHSQPAGLGGGSNQEGGAWSDVVGTAATASRVRSVQNPSAGILIPPLRNPDQGLRHGQQTGQRRHMQTCAGPVLILHWIPLRRWGQALKPTVRKAVET